MNRIDEIVAGLKILGNYSQHVSLKTGMILAGPEIVETNLTTEEQRMLEHSGWKFIPFYSRWAYIL